MVEPLTLTAVGAVCTLGGYFLANRGCNEHHWGQKTLTDPQDPQNWNLSISPLDINHHLGMPEQVGDEVGIILERYTEIRCQHTGCDAKFHQREDWAYIPLHELEENYEIEEYEL